MGLVVAPIKEGKLEAWKSWNAEITGARKVEWDDFNKRYGLDRHDVWHAETPAGSVAVVLHEGSGADDFMQKLAQSDNSFDVWVKDSIQDFHGMDLSGPPPGPMPVKMS